MSTMRDDLIQLFQKDELKKYLTPEESRRSPSDVVGRHRMSYDAHFRVWRGDDDGGELVDYTVEVNEGEVILDIIHRLQATQAGDLAVRWNCKAGKCGSCSAEVNGKPRLMCMTRMSTFAEDETVTVTPLRAFPVIKDLVTDVSFNYEKARQIPAFAPPAGVARATTGCSRSTSSARRSSASASSASSARTPAMCPRPRENKEAFAGPRFFIRAAELDMHPLDARDDRATSPATARASGCATSPSAAPRSAPSTSRSPTTRSSR